MGIKREEKACILFMVIFNHTAHNKILKTACNEFMKRHLRVVAKNENAPLSTVQALKHLVLAAVFTGKKTISY